jgi:hypothetical protein
MNNVFETKNNSEALKTFFSLFNDLSITELEDEIVKSESREEKLLFSKILDVKIGLAQEKVVGKELL